MPSLVTLFGELPSDGFEIEHASSGEAALAKPDGTMEVVSPDRRLSGKPGDGVTRHIRANRRQCPVVLVSADKGPEAGHHEFEADLENPVLGET